MSRGIGLLRTSVVGAALIGAGFVATHAIAQEFYGIDPHVWGCCEGGLADGANAWTDGNFRSTKWPLPPPVSPDGAVLLTGAVPVAQPVPYWWTHGAIELGYRGFRDSPDRNGAVYLDQPSLAKYYEYSDIRPGMFGGGHVAVGSSDGLYQADIWANNVGYYDQSYWVNANKAGEHYLSVVWDQTPHVYSTSAQTPWLGVGTSFLTLPADFPANGVPAGTTAAGVIAILPFLHQQDIGIERDTAAVGYRWTPTDAWDIRADYSHMTRQGSQIQGITWGGFGFGPQPTEFPAPVKDTTQNFGANGEYLGLSPWGKYTVKVAYNGSQYTDSISSYFLQNPYAPTLASCAAPTVTRTGGLVTAAAAGTPSCVAAQMSTPPSNSANGVTGTVAADLPLLSRYMGTVTYTAMRQNELFQPMTDNPLAVASPFNGGANWNTLGALPQTSLAGGINTLLSNNVITTKILPDLTSKLSYRYYNFDNNTPREIFPCWVSDDQTGVAMLSRGGNPCGGATSFSGTPPVPGLPAGLETTISSLSISYTKQNGGAALNWRPSREWNFNAEYGYEHYSYVETDVNATNENSGKMSVDWKPVAWFTVRASGGYGVRTFESYDYTDFVRAIQFPTVPPFTPQGSTAWFYAPAYQQFMFDHRRRSIANVAVDLVAFHGVTITPTFRFKDDNYGLNPQNQEGVSDSRLTSGGVDVGWVVTPYLSFGVSVYREFYDQTLYNYTNNATTSVFGLPFGWPFEAAPGNCTTGLLANCLITTSDRERIDTFTAVANWTAIPDQLDLTLRYTVSKGLDQQRMLTQAPVTACGSAAVPCQAAFPDVTTLFKRLDATAVYTFNRTWLHQIGWDWVGALKAKLRYTWENNNVNNWQDDLLAPFTPVITSPSANALWMGWNNPNYNVQMIAGSLITTW
jgi:Putative outer membrane beta-barrel porin, MtrB/PioB